MDCEVYEDVLPSDLHPLIKKLTDEGGTVKIEPQKSYFRVMVTYPPIVEQTVLDSLRSVGGL